MSTPSVRIPFDSPAAKIDATAESARRAEKDVAKYTAAVKKSIAAGGVASKQDTKALNESLKRSEAIKDSLTAQKKNEKLWGVEGHGLHQLQRMEQKFSRIFGEGSLLNKLMSGKEIKVTDVLHTAISSEKLMAGISKSMSLSPATMQKLAQYGHIALKVYEQFEAKNEFHKEQERYQETLAMKVAAHEMSPQEQLLYNERLDSWMGRWDFLFNKDRGKEAIEKNRALTKMFSGLSEGEVDRVFDDVAEKHTAGWSIYEDPETQRRAVSIIDKNGNAISGSQYKQRIERALRKAAIDQHHALSAQEEENVRAATTAGMEITEEAQKAFTESAEKIALERKIKDYLDPSQEYHKKRMETIYKQASDDLNKRVPANPTD